MNTFFNVGGSRVMNSKLEHLEFNSGLQDSFSKRMNEVKREKINKTSQNFKFLLTGASGASGMSGMKKTVKREGRGRGYLTKELI